RRVVAEAEFQELGFGIGRTLGQPAIQRLLRLPGERLVQQRLLGPEVAEEGDLVDAGFLGNALRGRAAGSRGRVDLQRRVEELFTYIHDGCRTNCVQALTFRRHTETQVRVPRFQEELVCVAGSCRRAAGSGWQLTSTRGRLAEAGPGGGSQSVACIWRGKLQRGKGFTWFRVAGCGQKAAGSAWQHP